METYFRGICGEVFYSLRIREAKLWPFFHCNSRCLLRKNWMFTVFERSNDSRCLHKQLRPSSLHYLSDNKSIFSVDPELARDLLIQQPSRRKRLRYIHFIVVPRSHYPDKQAPTAEAEHSVPPLTCRNVSVISSLGAVFLNFIDFIASTALLVCFTGEWQYI